MRVLILGGTLFLGRHLAASALARGHDLTLFHRGRTGEDLFPAATHVHGNRDGGLDALRSGQWDAVVDTSGFVPRIVRASAACLRDRVGHYTFVSSMSVYADADRPGVDETGAVATLEDPSTEEISGEAYGALKALCESAVEETLPGPVLKVRPGLIVGPHDSTDRFPYWPRRLARGGDVLAPGRPDAPVQFIDARDLADWILDMAERGATGVYNATGPKEPLTMGEFLARAARAVGSDAHLVWIDDEFLLANEVAPYSKMPLWIPQTAEGFNAFDCGRAFAADLRCRPVEETVRDTFLWDAARGHAERRPRPGVPIPPPLSAAREAGLLEKWRARARA